MKTYTIEQIKKYLLSQDSLGDIHYNLNKIDKILKTIELEENMPPEDVEVTDLGDRD